MKEEIDLYEENPTLRMYESWGKLWDVQKMIAPHFGADPKNFFFRSNVTQPLNEFILGVSLPEGSEILTSNQEYGAVANICRLRAERDHLKLKTFKMPSREEIRNIAAEEIVARITAAFGPKTRLLVISEIFTGNGIRLPIEEICREARNHGILSVIDGAHSPGYLDLKLENSECDYYAGNLHKWWMGPKGTGFGWIRRESFQFLKPIHAGWISYELAEPLASFGEGDLQAIRTLMLGCQDFSPFFALPAALEFWNEIGKKTILNRKRELDRFLIQEADHHLKLFRHASNDPRLEGPMHAFLLPKTFAKMEYISIIRSILEETGVQVSVTQIDRELYLRLSPHIYNTKEEIRTAIERMVGRTF